MANRSRDTDNIHCNTGDYATGGGLGADSGAIYVSVSKPMFIDGSSFSNVRAGQPNAWGGTLTTVNGLASTANIEFWVVCQTPTTVAGIGVPQFGSLYVAIALGAVAYFLLARRHSVARTTSLRLG